MKMKAVFQHGGNRWLDSPSRYEPRDIPGDTQEIPRVRGDHCDPQAGGVYCNQRIIRQSALSNFLVIILGGQTGVLCRSESSR
jgi:hypothetical protein